MLESISYSNVFTHNERLFAYVYKRYLFKHFKPLSGSFSQLSLIFSTQLIYIWNRRFILSRMIFVPFPYIKVSVCYDRIIKCV